MSATEVPSASGDAAVGNVDMHLEIEEEPEGRSHLLHRSGHDEDWPDWYAAYLVAEQAGTDLPA